MLKKIVQSKYFSGFILSVVLLNSLVLGLLTSPDITAKACDFQSAADARLGDRFTWFSIWF